MFTLAIRSGKDGDWANIILSSLEDVLPANSQGLTVTQQWTPVVGRFEIGGPDASPGGSTM
jgi:hypothetical protein